MFSDKLFFPFILALTPKKRLFFLHDLFFPDIPIIPDLEDVQEEELTAQVALPPRYVKHIPSIIDPL